MSLKKGSAPSEIQSTLTITGQGSTDKLKVVYFNRRASEIAKKFDDSEYTIAQHIPYIVKGWDTDFPLTEEGVKDFEDEYPGIIDVLIEGFWKSRRKEAEKN